MYILNLRVRNLTDVSDGFLLDSKFLIMDRDTKYTKAFRANLKREGIEPVRCPVRTPNCNAFAERFVRSVKEECLDRMILLGEASLRRALRHAIEITSPSGLPDRPSSALRQQLHSPAMHLLSRLEDERSCGASWSTYFVRIPNRGKHSI